MHRRQRHIHPPSTLEEWCETGHLRGSCWNRLYFGYKTSDNVVCLAKVLNDGKCLKRRDILRRLDWEYTPENLKKVGQEYDGKSMILIQVGNLVTIDDFLSNELMIDATKLMSLPVPIEIDLSKYGNQWIITNEMYKCGYNTCMQSIEYARKGEWGGFLFDIVTNRNIIRTAFKRNLNPWFKDYYFFDTWCPLREAIAHHKNDFIKEYLSVYGNKGHSFYQRYIFEVAAIYNNVWVFDNLSAQYHYFGQCFHKIIENKHYSLLIKMLNQYIDNPKLSYSLKESLLIESNDTETNILGTAILCNDLKAIKLILNWNDKKANINKLNVDSFDIWAGNTAIQTAFILCNDNFELIKYLLSQHCPKYDKYDLKCLDENDCYLVYKQVIKTHWDDTQYIVMERDKLKGYITFKPDSEGMTIDERIGQCQSEKTLTKEQCDELRLILSQRRSKWNIIS